MFFRNRANFKPGLHDIGEDELDSWSILTVDNPEHGSLVVRLRSRKPPIPDIRKYSTAIEITWNYSLQSAGLPDDATKASIDSFEKAIDELCWYNNLSFNVRITTGQGRRVWLFYTKSYDEFIDVFNDKASPLPTLPLTIEYGEDEDWGLWKEGLEEYVETD